jgi:hypothetical protein
MKKVHNQMDTTYSVPNADDLNQSGTPVQQILDRNDLEAQSDAQQTRYMMR